MQIQLDNSNTCDASAFAGLLRDRGVLVLPFGPNTIRAVTHRDITDKDIDIAIFAFRDVAARVWANSPHYVLGKLNCYCFILLCLWQVISLRRK